MSELDFEHVPISALDGIDVRIYSNEGWRPWDPELRRSIPIEWEKERKRDSNLYNSNLFRVTDIYKDLDTGVFNGHKTSYMWHWGTREEKEMKNRANPLTVGGLVLTKNNELVIGRNLTPERGNESLEIVGGYVDLDKDMLPEGKPSPGSAVFRELKEELGIGFNHILGRRINAGPRYVLREENERHPSLIYEIKTPFDRLEINTLFEKNSDSEFSEIEFIDFDIDSLEEELEWRAWVYRPRVRLLFKDLIENPHRLESLEREL